MRKSILLILITMMVSCEDPISVKLPTEPSKIVVEGVIKQEKTTQTVKISRTNGFLDNTEPPKLSGATVSVNTSDGVQLAYHESATPGTYHSDSIFGGIVGMSYQLVFTLLNGESYQSGFQKLRAVPGIDSVTFDNRNEDLAGYLLNIKLTDATEKGDFYRWKVYRNGEKLGTLSDLELRSDRLFNGNQFNVRFEKFLFNIGDTCRIEQFSLTESTYDFFRLLQTQAGESTSISPITGNVKNIARPSEQVQGFFYATSIAEISVVCIDTE